MPVRNHDKSSKQYVDSVGSRSVDFKQTVLDRLSADGALKSEIIGLESVSFLKGSTLRAFHNALHGSIDTNYVVPNDLLEYLKKNYPDKTIRMDDNQVLFMYSLGRLIISTKDWNCCDCTLSIEKEFMARSLQVFCAVISDYDRFYRNKELLTRNHQDSWLRHSSPQIGNFARSKLPNIHDSKIFYLGIGVDSRDHPVMELFYTNFTNEFTINNHIDGISREFQFRNKDDTDCSKMKVFLNELFKILVRQNIFLYNNEDTDLNNREDVIRKLNTRLGSNDNSRFESDKKSKSRDSSTRPNSDSAKSSKSNIITIKDKRIGLLIFSTSSNGKTAIRLDSLTKDILQIFRSVMKKYHGFYNKKDKIRDNRITKLNHLFKLANPNIRMPRIKDKRYFKMNGGNGSHVELIYEDRLPYSDTIRIHLNGILYEFKLKLRHARNSNMDIRRIKIFRDDILSEINIDDADSDDSMIAHKDHNDDRNENLVISPVKGRVSNDSINEQDDEKDEEKSESFREISPSPRSIPYYSVSSNSLGSLVSPNTMDSYSVNSRDKDDTSHMHGGSFKGNLIESYDNDSNSIANPSLNGSLSGSMHMKSLSGASNRVGDLPSIDEDTD